MSSIKSSSKRFQLLTVLMIILQTGCTMSPPAQDLHARLQKQSIAYIPLAPEIPVILDLEAKSKAEGFIKKGAIGSLVAAGGSSCAGNDGICGFILLSSLALGFVAGGIIGAVVATPEERAQDMEAAINKGVSSIAVQLDLPKKILKEVASYDWIKLDLIHTESQSENLAQERQVYWDELRQMGYSFAFETQITHFEFIGGEGFDPKIIFHLGVQATLVDLENSETVFEDTFYHLSQERRYSEWVSNSSEMFKKLLERNTTALSQEIVDVLFLQTNLPISSGTWHFPGTKKYGCCWLCPIAPPYEVDYWPKVVLKYPIVESLTPLLEWEAIGKEFEKRAINTGGIESKVTYDLRIWEALNDMKHDLVYEQTSLKSAKFQLSKPLKSQRQYFWSFRACISRQDLKSCTPWASSGIPSLAPALTEFDYCGSAVIQDWNYYRFETP